MHSSAQSQSLSRNRKSTQHNNYTHALLQSLQRQILYRHLLLLLLLLL
jgi:hypothetical protein